MKWNQIFKIGENSDVDQNFFAFSDLVSSHYNHDNNFSNVYATICFLSFLNYQIEENLPNVDQEVSAQRLDQIGKALMVCLNNFCINLEIYFQFCIHLCE